MSKTKLGAVILGIGMIAMVVGKVLSDDMTWMDAWPQIVEAIGAIIIVFGGRNAIQKLLDKS